MILVAKFFFQKKEITVFYSKVAATFKTYCDFVLYKVKQS